MGRRAAYYMSQESPIFRAIERFHAEEDFKKHNGEYETKAREWFYSPAYGKRVKLDESRTSVEGDIPEEEAETEGRD